MISCKNSKNSGTAGQRRLIVVGALARNGRSIGQADRSAVLEACPGSSLGPVPRLGVNRNKIALLCNSRQAGVPDVLHFARIARDIPKM